MPTNSQYIELRAVTIKELDGKDYQLVTQVWAHNLQMKSFTFRIQFDSNVMKPSVIKDVTDEDGSITIAQNDYIEENEEDEMTWLPEYFEFENGFENNLDSMGYYKDNSIEFEVSLLPDEFMTGTNTYIKNKSRSRNNNRFNSIRRSINRKLKF